MPEGLLELALRESVEEVLEKMFFVRTMEEVATSHPEADLAARLTFEGDPSGALTLSVRASAARSVAADFLAAEEPDLSEEEIGEVLGISSRQVKRDWQIAKAWLRAEFSSVQK